MIINEPSRSEEIEQQILGLLITDATHSSSREAIDSLEANDFYNVGHRYIFNAIKSMSENKKQISLVLLDDELQGLNVEYGGFVYLAHLAKDAISIYNMGSYVSVIKKNARLRNLSQALSNGYDLINQKLDATEVIEILEGKFKDISTNSNGKDLRHIRDLEGDFLDELEKRAERGGSIAGLSTGVHELDERLNGIDNESLVIVAGSPSMGKTLFCQTIATSVSVDQKKNAMFFSMEMSERTLFERFVSGIGNVRPDLLKRARLDKEANGRITEAVTLLRSCGLYITDEPKQSVGQIRAKVRRHKIKHPELSAIFIDYLGLMKLGQADRHDIAIGNITRDLKELAKEVKVPIFLCVQSKRPQNIKDRPNMSSLKDSSCIEADADVILFVHRQEIIEPETDMKGITELIIAKDRHNDGNGTIYLEKVNGSFSSISTQAAAMLKHRQEIKTNQKPKKGFSSDTD